MGSRKTRVIGSIMASSAGLLLSACSGLHLYDKDADTLAAAAKSSYEGSKVLTVLNAEQGNYDVIEKKEFAVSDKIVSSMRDQQLLALLSHPDQPFAPRFARVIEHRIGEIVPFDGSKKGFDAINAVLRLDSVETTNLLLRKKADTEHRRQLISADAGFGKLAPCVLAKASLFERADVDALKAATGDPTFAAPPWVLPSYQQYVTTSCANYLSAQKTLQDGLKLRQAAEGRDLGRAWSDAKALRTSLDQRKADVVEAKLVLEVALAAYVEANKERAESAASLVDCAKKSPAPNDANAKPDPKAIAETKAEKDVCWALDRLNQLGDAGVKQLTEQRIKKIEIALAALGGVASDDDLKDLPSGLALLNATVRFTDALKSYHRAEMLPPLEPLLIEKQLLAARLDAATRGASFEQKRVDSAQEKADGLRQELDLLMQARAELDRLSPHDAKASLSVLLKSKKIEDGQSELGARGARRALGLYADSYTVARARSDRADNQLIMLAYREAHMRSQAAVLQWDTLIATPLVQLQTFHGGGIKPAAIAELVIQAIQAAGVAHIATK
jgi:hypothetical protein